MSDYKDGWVGFTKAAWDKMHKGCYNTWPSWCECSSGNGFKAEATLKANGLHPDKIPEILRDDKGTIGQLIAKIAKEIPLTYVPTPDN